MSTDFNSFIDGLSDAEFDRINAMDATEIKQYQIRKEAHIANGGEAANHPCPDCRGTGNWRVGYRCFKCNGTGKITNRQMGAVKGKATAAANKAQFASDNADVIEFLAANTWSDFYKSLFQQFSDNGKLSDKQVAAVRSGMAKQAARKEEKAAERVAAAPVIDNVSAIVALFDKASQKIAKKVIFRTTEITINKAPMQGRNPGALYVTRTDDKAYCGKIVDGKFHKGYGAPDVTEALRAVAVDPTAEAIAYASKFKACSCCGKTLRNPVSVAAVVGPICAGNWGLEHLRIAAAEALKEEKAEEKRLAK